jgi:diguanylate cyclase (GGDEF)-like protein
MTKQVSAAPTSRPPGRPPAPREVVLQGRSVGTKFALGMAISGVAPLLFLIYLGLPLLLPHVASQAFYPRGGALFVVMMFLLGLLQMLGFYVIYIDVVGQVRSTLQFELAYLRESLGRAQRVSEDLRVANLRLRDMSLSDELTEVGNRRNFDMRLREEISRSNRFGHTFSLLMIDIDRFKRVNDEFGHPKGDMSLRSLGGLMRAMSREGDVPCRVGGEEFAFILPETAKADALTFAERLRRGVEANLVAPDGSYPLTVSLGVAAFPDDGKTTEEIVWAADEALYHSKREGRNRVTAYARRPA